MHATRRLLVYACAAPFVLFGGVGLAQKLRTKTLTAPEVLALQKAMTLIKDGRSRLGDAKYVGHHECVECHANVDTRDTSLHHLMKREVTAFSVKCKFDGTPITFAAKAVNGAPEGATFRVTPFIEGEQYRFTVHGDDPKDDQTFVVAKATGGALNQQAFEAGITDPSITLGSYEMTFPAPMRCEIATGAWIRDGQTPHLWVMWKDGKIVPRKQHELAKNEFAQGKCWGCHTTGYTFTLVQDIWRATHDNGPGELGVRCETCHGPGSAHIEAVEKLKAEGRLADVRGNTPIIVGTHDLDATQQMHACGRCHVRPVSKQHKGLGFAHEYLTGDRDLAEKILFASPDSGDPAQMRYFRLSDKSARNGNTQLNEVLHGAHEKAGVTCITCHAPHSGIPSQLRMPTQELCASCHGAGTKGNQVAMYRGSPMQKAGVTCADCHMAKRGRRSNDVHVFQVTSHQMSVAPPKADLETGDRSSCAACHIDAQAPRAFSPIPKRHDAQALSSLYEKRARSIRRSIQDLRAQLATLPDVKAIADLKRKATANVDIVVNDGSAGVHNYQKARQLLGQARTHIADARTILRPAPTSAAKAPQRRAPAPAPEPGLFDLFTGRPTQWTPSP